MRLLHFTAEWCYPCQMMKPMIEQVVEDYGIEYVPIDIDTNMETAVDYGVSSVPTFILFEGDELKSRVSGAMMKGKFLEALGL